MDKVKIKKVCLRIDKEVAKDLKDTAKKTKRSQSVIAEKGIRKELERMSHD